VENEELEERIKDVSKHLLKVQGWKLFASLGIPQVGRTAGKTLIEHFGSMEGIMNASEEDLEAVGGIGPISAKSTYDYFRKNSTMVSDLLLRFELELPKQGDLSGQSFCLTGGFEEGKEHWHELIESRGGKAAKSVSKTTTYLVAGEKTGKTKMEAAKKLGVKVITATDLKTILE
jgi:DNA ligase (NAD+)